MNSLSGIGLIVVGLFSLAVANSINVTKTVSDSNETKVIPKLYAELACKEITESTDDGNFTRFDCADFKALATDKCHLKGKSYNVSEKADENDIPHCTAQCSCLQFGSKSAEFSCAEIECPENFGTRDWNCVSQYKSLKECCRSDEVCDRGKIGEMHKCEFGGKTYKEGERIYPDSEQCYECLCTEHFNATLKMSENSDCMPIDCGIELRHLNEIRDGCIPIYYKNGCCPIEFKCPSENDAIEVKTASSSTNATTPPNNDKLTCKFGTLTMKMGDKLKTDTCTRCECSIPPIPTCIRTDNC